MISTIARPAMLTGSHCGFCEETVTYEKMSSMSTVLANLLECRQRASCLRGFEHEGPRLCLVPHATLKINCQHE